MVGERADAVSLRRLGVLRSRVGRRIVAMFLVAAALPVGLSGWLAYSTVDQVIGEQRSRAQQTNTRIVALAVLGRLLEAKSLLLTWPDALPSTWSEPAGAMASAAGAASRGRGEAALLPGWVSHVDTVLWLDAEGGVHPLLGVPVSGSSANELQPLIRFAVPAAALGTSEGAPASSETALVNTQDGIELLTSGSPQGVSDGVATAATVWLRRRVAQGAWLVRLNAARIWEPVTDATADGRWIVRDAAAQTLWPLKAAPAQSGVAHGGGSGHVLDASALKAAHWSLPLNGEFATRGSWAFQLQPEAGRTAAVAGLSVGDWATRVGAATLLLAAVLSLVLIRRTLIPLEQLRDGTSRLLRREPGVRVQVNSRDEFGELSGAFNRMARHLERQFDALERLAVLDRSVLDGTPEPQIIGRALEAVARWMPDAMVLLLRFRVDEPLVATLHRPGSLNTLPLDLSAAEAQLLQDWQRDTALRAADWNRRLPCWLPPVAPAEPWMVGLPLRWGGKTHALMVLGLARPQELQGDLRRFVRDLRDHLTVALSAREREEELRRLAIYDVLTGLLSRHGLHESLTQLLQDDRNPAVLFIDLDQFKQVNDTLGHDAGDELLCQVAARLRQQVPGNALIARPGGDEFVVVLPDCHAESLPDCSALAQRLCAALALPFPLRGQTLPVGASIGVAMASRHGRSREDLLRQADIAMYQAKREGRGRHAVFDRRLETQVQDRAALLADLRLAIERREFELHYQPRVRNADGRVVSVEALVRWQHPQQGLLMPGRFIGLAEEAGLIEAIGNQVLEAACEQMARWRISALSIERVSVNVSALQLQSGELVQRVFDALQAHGLPPQALELEVTESLLASDASDARAQLEAIRRRGVLIALDDFGTGYSSMATLRQLPVDVMKIDRAFVCDLGRDDGALAIARAIVTLARSLRMHIVAEGMETQEQSDMLCAMGVDELQGFYFARPMTVAQLERWPRLTGAVETGAIRQEAAAALAA